ncbi:nuclear pore complex subunit [Histomonas meleagridis]|uniref:nuclear pore complex subunit n=1 Tax=Histomonas meleagridis TaxID=135588 RepID=UPI00355A26A6|nr:nuclear pore complex subunit [Histomonas meleagridis]KAH0804921.1 nuclear pore complex subunit [Histomonas meleagridis]
MPRPRIQKRKLADDPWNIVSKGIQDTLSRKQSGLSMSYLHMAVHSLISNGDFRKLEDGLSDLITAHFKTYKDELSQLAGNPLIVRFSNIFSDFENYCLILPKFCMLLDRHYESTIPQRTLTLIREKFLQGVLSDKNLIKMTIDGIIKDITTLRRKEEIDLSYAKNLVKMFYNFKNEANIKIFESFFDKFVEETKKFYDDFYVNKFGSNSFSNYLKIIEDQINHEQNLLQEFLNAEDAQKILFICFNVLVISRESNFLEGREPLIASALVEQDCRPLKWLVETYQRFSIDIENLYNSCATFIQNEMLKLIPNFEPPAAGSKAKKQDIPTSISQLMEVTMKHVVPYNTVFTTIANAPVVKKAAATLKEAITKAWNNDKFDIKQNFNVYIDSIIRSEYKSIPIEKFANLVAYFCDITTEKKPFEVIYEAMFMRRLIKIKKKLPDLELPVISAIRNKVSHKFLERYDQYIKQLNDSFTFEEDFKTYKSQNKQMTSELQISPLVFNGQSFPLPKDEEKNMPTTISEANREFVQYYKTKHPTHNLLLLSTATTVEFKLQIPKNAKSAIPRTYQIVCDVPTSYILSTTAEKKDGMKFSEMCDLLGNRNMAGKIVLNLSSATNKILDRYESADPKKLDDNDKFRLNRNFFSQNQRINIKPALSESKLDKKETHTTIMYETTDAIKASICRILKREITMNLSDLENTVILDLREFFITTPEKVRLMAQELETTNGYVEQYTEGGVKKIKYIR